MKLRTQALPWLTLMVLSGGTIAAAEDDPCMASKWNLTREHALFSEAAQSAAAGRDAASAPDMKAGRLYELSLSPQDGVKFVVPPGKKAPPDGAFAGLIRLQVPAAGTYRISLDQGFWIDVIDHQQIIEATDFAGLHGCAAPRKIVLYNLPAGKDLVLQLSGAAKDRVRVTLTPSSAPAP